MQRRLSGALLLVLGLAGLVAQLRGGTPLASDATGLLGLVLAVGLVVAGGYLVARSASGGDPALDLVFVLTPRAAAGIDPARVLEAHRRLAPGVGPALALDEPVGPDEGALSFTLEGVGSVITATLPLPVPNGEAEHAASYSLFCLGDASELSPHEGHVMVVFQQERGDLTRVEAHRILTRVVAAIAEGTDAVGVYWGPGHVAHPSEPFVEAVRELEPDDMPLQLWCGLSIAREPEGGLSLLTIGFEDQLALPDLLVHVNETAPEEAIPVAFDILAYVAGRGEAIPEGDTVGRSAEEQLPVRYVPSPIDANRRVAEIRLP